MLSQNQLDEAIGFAQEMLCELRTVLLTPKIYYELYMIGKCNAGMVPSRLLSQGEVAKVVSHKEAPLSFIPPLPTPPPHIFVLVCDEMRHIHSYFGEVHRNGMKCVKLYEKVQNVTEVLPRL